MAGILSPSVMCADLFNLSYEIKRLESLKVKYIHIDYMDNKFVPNITFNVNMIRKFKKLMKNAKRDIHIMAYEPYQYFDTMEIGEGDMVSVHYEACEDAHYTISEIKRRGALPIIAINPDTPVETIKDFLNEVYGVLLMTVYPGFAGQPLAPNSMERISQLKDIIMKSKRDVKIQVDGHVSWKLGKEMYERGADIFVGGTSSIYGKDLKLEEAIERFNKLIR